MKHLMVAALLAVGGSAGAEVRHSNPNGFDIRHSVEIRATPEKVLRTFERIGSWWSSQHSYSGSASNLTLSLKPGACFCEALPNGGGVEHMRVAYVDPGKRVVLAGALGPLLFEATTGVMDVQVEATASGSRLSFAYKAAGFANGGADKLAPRVDAVLAEQLGRLVEASQKP